MEEKKDPSICDCTIVDAYITDEDYQEFKHVTCLGMAILKNDSKGVEVSLGKGCNVNFDKTIHCYDGPSTLLIMACRRSSLPIVSLLVKHPGIKLDRRNAEGETALAWAVRKSENLDIVKLMVEAGAKIYLRDGEGFSHLHRAVEAVEEGEKEKEEGALEIVKYLHSKGASIHTHDKARTTPLWTAVREQNLPMVRYLVENGAKLDSPKCSYGASPFHMAVKHGNAEIVKFMIEKGADIHGDEKCHGETVFEIAQKGKDSGEDEYEIKENKEKYGQIIDMLKSAEEDYRKNIVVKIVEDIVEEFVLSEGEGPKYKNISSLGMAVLQNDIEAVKSSLATGCDVNFYETEFNSDVGWTPLILACEHSSLDIVKLLVEHPGVDLESTTTDHEEVALNRAVRRDDNLDMVKLLVEAGADPDMRDAYGFSHLHRAADSGQLDYIKYLQSKGAWINTQACSYTPLWQAAYDGNLELVKYLASQGATLDIPSADNGYFPLNAAVAGARVDVVKFLIEQGADVNKESAVFGSRDGVSRSNWEIAKERINASTFEIEKIPLYEEIFCILKEAGAKGSDNQVFTQLVLETIEAIMHKWAEKWEVVDGPSQTWYGPDSGVMPQCMKKLKVLTKEHDNWLAMIKALVDVVPFEHPMGPIAITLLLKSCPMPVDFEPTTNVDTYLKVLEMATSFAANDIRHRNISIIISCIGGDIKRWSYRWSWIGDMCQLLLTTDMLDYLFGNLKPGSNPEVAIFSLLALEFLADETNRNPCGEIVRNHFMEFSPDDHPLLQLEKLVDSANLIERQLGFCSRWYLDNLWTIDIPDARRGKIDKPNINTTLTASEKSKYLKIGPSGLEVRSDGPWFETAKSTVQVDKGSWYYEVTIVTGGLMQIGWATKQSTFLEREGYGVGDDEFSQSYDGCRQVVWYDRQQPSGSRPRGWENEGDGPINSWKPGDVVGSLIDIENQEIVFSLNGVSIVNEPYRDVFDKVKDGFFATISLMCYQQCQVNFGKDPFKHPPEGKTFKPLNEASIKNA